MGFFDKFIPKELKKPVDKFLDFGTDTFKKAGRAVRKLTPRELRPGLPFLSAALPFMLPGGFTMMGMNPAFSRGIMSALANATSQEALDPEGDINYLSAALSWFNWCFRFCRRCSSEARSGLKFTGDNPVTERSYSCSNAKCSYWG
jgi:hypothetical protein